MYTNPEKKVGAWVDYPPITPVEKARIASDHRKELENLRPFDRQMREEELGLREIRTPSTLYHGEFTYIRTPYFHDYVFPCLLRDRFPGYVEEIEEIEGSFDPTRNMPLIIPSDRKVRFEDYPKPYVGPRRRWKAGEPQKPLAPTEQKSQSAQHLESILEVPEQAQMDEDPEQFKQQQPSPPQEHASSAEPLKQHEVVLEVPEKKVGAWVDYPPITPVEKARIASDHRKELENLRPFDRQMREEELGLREIRTPSTLYHGEFTYIRTPYFHDYVFPCLLRDRFPGYVEEIEEIEGSFDPTRNMPLINPSDRKVRFEDYPKPYVGPRRRWKAGEPQKPLPATEQKSQSAQHLESILEVPEQAQMDEDPEQFKQQQITP
ncbi:hypothetical protein QR680_012387 [Steinernema hermaphroditum]|uniref:Uncharacterized protein n=1 Tax=Steinernema hermaphroditum TaxID=289476 RepID=A0AA39I455_9BILA|nr:hypothetical protein QR680_012387 [Steinernema hermaphroditum]